MANSKDRVVWILNQAGHDFSAAEKYGELKALTVGNVNPLQVDRLAWELSRGIGGFVESEEDFLLISGTPILAGLAVHFWLRHFGKCKLLLFNAKKQDYKLSTITEDQLGNLLDKAVMR